MCAYTPDNLIIINTLFCTHFPILLKILITIYYKSNKLLLLFYRYY